MNENKAKSARQRMAEYRSRQREIGARSRSFMMSDVDYEKIKQVAAERDIDLNEALHFLLSGEK